MLIRHVFLTGMPGTGKSSLGRRAANELRLPYHDTDQMIAGILGCEVSGIFERYGEDAFRAAETNILIQLTRMEPAIVSTGGGTVLRDINREIMRNHGYIVLIDRPPDQIKRDIRLDRRPLLAQKGLGEVDRLYEQRIDLYRAAADEVLDNGHGYGYGLNGLERIIRAL